MGSKKDSTCSSWLWRWRKRVMSQGMLKPPAAGKSLWLTASKRDLGPVSTRNGILPTTWMSRILPWSLQKGLQPCWHLDLAPDFWPMESKVYSLANGIRHETWLSSLWIQPPMEMQRRQELVQLNVSKVYNQQNPNCWKLYRSNVPSSFNRCMVRKINRWKERACRLKMT